MENPFVEISQKLDSVLKRLDAIEQTKHAPTRVPFTDFCQERNITRPTAYAWADRGLIQLEKIGGRQYVKADSITITNKYQRKEQA